MRAPQLNTAHSASITASGESSENSGTCGSCLKENGSNTLPYDLEATRPVQEYLR